MSHLSLRLASQIDTKVVDKSLREKYDGYMKSDHDADVDPIGGMPGDGGDPDGVADDGVAIAKSSSGQAYFMPVRLRNAPPETRALIAAAQGQVRAMMKARLELDRTVAQLREADVSWGSIGWTVGLTPDGARKRWAESDDDLPTG